MGLQPPAGMVGKHHGKHVHPHPCHDATHMTPHMSVFNRFSLDGAQAPAHQRFKLHVTVGISCVCHRWCPKRQSNIPKSEKVNLRQPAERLSQNDPPLSHPVSAPRQKRGKRTTARTGQSAFSQRAGFPFSSLAPCSPGETADHERHDSTTLTPRNHVARTRVED